LIKVEGSDINGLDDEDDVIPPSKTNRATGRRHSSCSNNNIIQTETNFDDDYNAAADNNYEDDTEACYGSNLGTVQLPYTYTKVTHPPEGDEIMGRMKKVHLVIHLLSGTHAKMGYTVSCPPKGNRIIITHQKGMEYVFWGHTGRAMVPVGVARDQLTLACSVMTTNFTNISRQVQIIEFPFAIDKVLKKKPFFVNTGNGPGQQFLGLYICAKVDWTDIEAEGAGDDYIELHSPVPKPNNANSFYGNCDNMPMHYDNTAANHSRFSSNPPRNTGISKGLDTASGTSHKSPNLSNLNPSEQKLLEALLEKMNVRWLNSSWG
jgi:hypothetical protein